MDDPNVPTLRALYPDATSNAALRGHAVEPATASNRVLGWLTVAGALGGFACFGLAAVLQPDDTSTGAPSPGTGTGVAAEASPVATWLLLVGGVLLMVGIACGLLVRRRVQRADARDTHVPWDRWVADRGFVAAALPVLGWPRPDVRLDQACVVGAGTVTRYGPWVGRAGATHVVVGGITDHVPGSGKIPSHDRTTWYAHVVLSEYAGALFPGASVSRTGRGHERWLHEGNAAELRLESTQLDSDAIIRVCGGVEDPRWRALFDTTVLEALAASLDVELRLDGRHLTVIHGTFERCCPTAPTERLDTMCAAAEFLARHIEAIAARSAAAARASAA